MPIIDISGKRFGSLVALSMNGRDKHNKILWLCKCDCGKELDVVGNKLRNGNTKSCGCSRASALQKARKARKNNGYTTTHKKANQAWRDMWSRCTNHKHKSWLRYGGRGISVCDRWKDFKFFLEDMGDPPDGHSIDRINNDGNYDPLNCQWATRSQQMRNTSRNVHVLFEGEVMCASDVVKKLGLNKSHIYYKINKELKKIEKRLSNNKSTVTLEEITKKLMPY